MNQMSKPFDPSLNVQSSMFQQTPLFDFYQKPQSHQSNSLKKKPMRENISDNEKPSPQKMQWAQKVGPSVPKKE